VIAVLAASIATENAAIIALAAVGIAFTVLSSPVSGHAIARAGYRRRRAAEERPAEP
jgi:multisubunit Na+/H+ antiporter MnhG subunit